MNTKIILTALFSLVALAGQAQTNEPFFRTDSAVIIGKIVGLKAEAMPKQVSVNWNNSISNTFEGNNLVDIAADGTFTFRMQLHHPILNTLTFSENEQVQYYLIPGETLQMEIYKNADGRWNCKYNAGSSAKRVERLLKENLDFTNEYRIMQADRSDLKRHTFICDSLIISTLDKLNALADAKKFTSYERQLACTMATSMICTGFFSRHNELFRGNFIRALRDSTFKAELCSPEYYAPIKYLPLNDPILFVPYSSPRLLISLSATPVCSFVTIASYYAEEFQRLRQAMNCMMGDKDNLLTQMAIMQKLPTGLTSAKEAYERRLQALADTMLTAETRAEWAESYVPLDTVYERVISGFSQPELRKEAERLFSVTFNESFTYPIPDGDGKALFERIIKPYRGKVVLIDFWAMWCGPCKEAIEKSRDLRRSLKDNPDIQLVFIAQEDNPETNETYKQYVAENLLGADCYPISSNELSQLSKLFQFKGIPQYVTILPDGQRLRKSLNYFSNNYDLFLQQLDEIKQKLSINNETKQ